MKSLADFPDDIVEIILCRLGTREKHRLLASGDARFAWRIHRRIHKFQFHMNECMLLLPSWSHLRELKLTYKMVKSNPFKIPSLRAPLPPQPRPSFSPSSNASEASRAVTPPFTISTILPNLTLLKMNWNSAFWLSDLGAVNCATMFPSLRFLYFDRLSQNKSQSNSDFTFLDAWPLLETLHLDLNEGSAIYAEIANHLSPNLKHLKLPSMWHTDSISYVLPQTLTHLDVSALEYDWFNLQNLPSLHTLCLGTIHNEQVFDTPLPPTITSLTVRGAYRMAKITLERATALLTPSIKRLSIPYMWPLAFLSTAIDSSVDLFSKLTRLDFDGTAAFQTFIGANLHRFVNLVEMRMFRTENFRYNNSPALHAQRSHLQKTNGDKYGDTAFVSLTQDQQEEKEEYESPTMSLSMPPSLRHLTIGFLQGTFSENIFMPNDYEKGALFQCKHLQSLLLLLHSTFAEADDAGVFVHQQDDPRIFIPYISLHHKQSVEGMTRIIEHIHPANSLRKFWLTSEISTGLHGYTGLGQNMSPFLFEKLMSRLQNVHGIYFHNISLVTQADETGPDRVISRLPKNLRHLDLSNAFETVAPITDELLKDCMIAMPRHLKTLRIFCSMDGNMCLLRIVPILLDGPQKQLLPFLRYFSAAKQHGCVYHFKTSNEYFAKLSETRIENYHSSKENTSAFWSPYPED